MAQRNSEYDRVPGDLYVTPQWCFDVLYEQETFVEPWDCAPVNATFNFLECSEPVSSIVTNPPFNQSVAFVRHALDLTKEAGGKVAFLLPLQWDTAKGRVDLFTEAPFKSKLVMTTRIRWTNLPQKSAGPSSNHAWYVWDWDHEGKEPVMRWI